MPKHSEHTNAILSIMARYGQMGIPHLTAVCHDEGVWTEEEWSAMAFDGAKKQVRDAVKVKMANGLPFAVPTRQREDKSPVWCQLNLLDYDDARFYLYSLIQGVTKDVKQIEAFQQYMEDRWGEAPPIPEWKFANESDGLWLFEEEARDDEEDEEEDD